MKSSSGNTLLGIGAVVTAMALLLWVNLDRLLLTVPGLLIDLRTPTGPNRPVVWESGPAPAHLTGDTPPNIILIVADDLGWNDISFYGGGVAGGTVPTSHIDSIARDGVHLDHALAASAVCAPSRAALMTGRYPTRFGYEFTPMPDGMAALTRRLDRQRPGADALPLISHLGDGVQQAPYADMGVPPEEITLAEQLGQHGYRTLHIGKWHLGDTGGSEPTAQGFDQSLNMASLLYLPEDHPDAVNARQSFDPIDRFFWSVGRHAVNYNGGERFAPDGYLTDYLTRQAVAAIEANRNRPFFLYLAHWAPHSPLQALREDYQALGHIEDHTLRVYAAMIRALDRGVGEVLDALEAQGIADNTLVVFTSDNGAAHYLGLPGLNAPFRGWKTTFYEGGIRVPLFLRWPARIPAGSRYGGVTHHVDLWPTLAEAGGAGGAGSHTLDGDSLLDRLTSDDAEPLPRQPLFWRSGHYQAVLDGQWKLQTSDRPERHWLYDLSTDPTEQNDVSDRHPGKVAELLALLQAHNREQVAPMWPSVLEAPVTIDQPLGVPIDPSEDAWIYWPN